MHRQVIASRIIELLESPELCVKCLDNDEERIQIAEALTDLFYCEACESPLKMSELHYGMCRDCSNFASGEPQ